MIYIGTVKEVKGYEVVVDIPHHAIAPTCAVLQPSAMAKKAYNFPAVGDQVATVVTEDVRVVLGALYSERDGLPNKGKGNNVVTEMGDGKFCLENEAMGLKRLLLSLAKLLKSLKVATAMGPSGTILPDVAAQVALYEGDVKKLIDGTE